MFSSPTILICFYVMDFIIRKFKNPIVSGLQKMIIINHHVIFLRAKKVHQNSTLALSANRINMYWQLINTAIWKMRYFYVLSMFWGQWGIICENGMDGIPILSTIINFLFRVKYLTTQFYECIYNLEITMENEILR